MNCPQWEDRLNEWVDGTLEPLSRQDVERHVESCAACREAAAGLRALVNRARELPREIQPHRNLLVDPDEMRGDEPPVGWMRWAAVAAMLLVVIGVLVVASQSVETPWPVGAGSAVVTASHENADGLGAAERDYAEATRMLVEQLERQRDRLSPETLVVFEKNLKIIDDAIAELRAALDGGPAEPRDERLLAAMQRQRIELLRILSRLSS